MRGLGSAVDFDSCVHSPLLGVLGGLRVSRHVSGCEAVFGVLLAGTE